MSVFSSLCNRFQKFFSAASNIYCSALNNVSYTSSFLVLFNLLYPVKYKRDSVNSQNHDIDSDPKNYHFCGGTLITAKHVLTAAHCLEEYTPQNSSEILVKINKGDLADSKLYEVKRWTTYDEWVGNEVTNNHVVNDIAIVELTKKVSSKIKLAVVTNTTEAELSNKTAVVAGWGLIENKKRTRHLTTAEVNVLTAKECMRNLRNDVFSQIDNSPHKFLCSSAEPPVNVECGDSGSPLLINWNEIIGVTKGDCFKKSATGMTRRQNSHMSVEYYKQFITDVTKSKNKRCSIQ